MQLLPWGDKLTSESLRFFSPIVIWTKFSTDHHKHQVLYSAFKDYFEVNILKTKIHTSYNVFGKNFSVKIHKLKKHYEPRVFLFLRYGFGAFEGSLDPLFTSTTFQPCEFGSYILFLVLRYSFLLSLSILNPSDYKVFFFLCSKHTI